MKTLELFVGSPRSKGNTNFLAKHLISQLDTCVNCSEIIDLTSTLILPCTDCRGCKRGDLSCIVDDGMQPLFDKLENADIIVVGTPIYWYTPSAQTKVFLDRLRPYYGNKKLKGKKAALLMAAGSGAADCDLSIEMFTRMCDALEMDFIGYAHTEAFDLGDAAKDMDALNQIKQLANLMT